MKFLTPFFRLLLTLLFIGSTFHAYAAELRIGYAPNTFYSPILVAKQKKWLEEELAAAGLGATTVKWQSFSAGPMMNEAIASGQLDIIFTGDLPAIIGKSIGFETHVIGIASSGYLSQAGVVLANSSIKSVKDLKGKKVATFKGTIAHHLLILALNEANMKLSDIELVNLTLPDMNNALQRGDVAAAFLWEPLLSQLELDHSVRVIRDGKGLKNAIAVILATDDYVAKHRAESKVVLKAFKRGAELIKRNPAEATKLVAAELNQPLPIIRRSLDKFIYGPEFSPQILDSLASAEVFLRGERLTRTTVDVTRFMDQSLVRELGSR